VSSVRPPPANGYCVGIDLGATNVKVVAVSATGRERYRGREPTAEGPEDWTARIRAWLVALESELGTAAAGVGLAAPGLVAPDGRSIAWMQGRMSELQGLDWTEALGLGLPVPVLNDAHAALLGETWIGAGQEKRDVVLLTLGTGVGGGILVGGRVLRGHTGRGGHLGHITLDADHPPDIVGTPGSLEDAIGECTVAARSGGRFNTTEALVSAHRSGDAAASQVWLRSVHRLACGIASLINVLDPEIVVLGGGITRAGPDLFQPLTDYLGRVEWRPLGVPTPVVPAALGDFAGAFGAARNAITWNPS
jgi:glucokinase